MMTTATHPVKERVAAKPRIIDTDNVIGKVSGVDDRNAILGKSERDRHRRDSQLMRDYVKCA